MGSRDQTAKKKKNQAFLDLLKYVLHTWPVVETTKNKGMECSNRERRLAKNWLGLDEVGSTAKPWGNQGSTRLAEQYYLETSSTLEIHMCISREGM